MVEVTRIDFQSITRDEWLSIELFLPFKIAERPEIFVSLVCPLGTGRWVALSWEANSREVEAV